MIQRRGAELWPSQLAARVDHGCMLLIHSCDGQAGAQHQKKFALVEFLKGLKQS